MKDDFVKHICISYYFKLLEHLLIPTEFSLFCTKTQN